MYQLIFVVALASSALADVSHLSHGHARILRQNFDIQPDGYQWAYDTENGIHGQEQASIRALGPEDADKSAQGSFSWTSPEGEHVSVQYLADSNGYQPQGSHIPIAPPVPEAIQKALAYIAAHPPHPDTAHATFPKSRSFLNSLIGR